MNTMTSTTKKTILGLLGLCVLSLPARALEIGDDAPDFKLPTPNNEIVSLSDFKDKTVVLEWTNPGCPFVKKHYKGGDMQKLQKESREKGVVWLSINSTNPKHQDHLSKSEAAKSAEELGTNPDFMLFDSAGTVGRLYSAKTTPHVFVIEKGKVVYQGAIDNDSDVFSKPADAENYVTNALEAIAKGETIKTARTSPYGCGVKYPK